MTKAEEAKHDFILYDEKNREIYFEESNGYFGSFKYDESGNCIFYKNSNKYWAKSKYDKYNCMIYREDSNGNKINF